MNKYDKYKNRLHDTYLPKIQRVIDVLNSCETEEQVDVCVAWSKRLILQWSRYEDWSIDKNHDGWAAASMSMDMSNYLQWLIDMFALSLDRKRKELSKKEEF